MLHGPGASNNGGRVTATPGPDRGGGWKQLLEQVRGWEGPVGWRLSADRHRSARGSRGGSWKVKCPDFTLFSSVFCWSFSGLTQQEGKGRGG